MKCCIGEKIDDPKKEALLKKINGLALAAFLIMLGVIWMQPEGALPRSTWIFALGLVLIAGNIARYLFGVGMCCCSAVLGVILAVAGGSHFYGVDFPVFPVLIILAGVAIAIGVISGKGCCSGKGSDTDLSCWKPGEKKTAESEDKE